MVGAGLLFTALFFAGTLTALAATDTASTNESFTQGLQKNGAAVAVPRSDPAQALGASDGQFVSLGYGGEIIVGFNQNMSGNLLLTVQEVTGGVYPLESADVYVSTAATGPWTLVGEATNEGGLEDAATEFAVAECYQFVRVMDTTDAALHDATSDGFDLDSLAADYDVSCPVVEPTDGGQKNSHTSISLHSKAVVMNDSRTTANTGGNLADGSFGGAGGAGGDIANGGGEQDVEEATTGDGGNGGGAGLGGFVQSGDALAESSVANTVNSTVIRINGCGCDLGSSRVKIRTNDFAMVKNRTMTRANTGDNGALGSYAGDGGAGGDIDNGIYGEGEYGDNEEESGQEVDDSTTGNGGTGGNASDGGQVLTGTATTRSAIANIVNSNRIRVR